jgi:HEPN domain-containing protein
MVDLSKQRLVEIADEKLEDAKLLLSQGRAGNAYYLAGYAVELLLKAVLSSRFRADTLPDPTWLRDVFTHNLERLLKLSLLDEEVRRKADVDDEFKAKWAIVLEWNESTRYYIREQRDAIALVEAIDGQQNGIYPWLKERL